MLKLIILFKFNLAMHIFIKTFFMMHAFITYDSQLNIIGDEGAKLIAKAIGANYKLGTFKTLYLRKLEIF